MKKIKYLLIVLFTFFIGISNIYAMPETKNREELENYGVNKKWEITDTNKSNVLKTKLVNSDEKIYDFSEVLTDEEISNLKKLSEEFTKKTNMDIIILIDNLEYSIDTQNEDYAADFYDYNDFGLNLDKNYSGLLLFRNTYEQDPYYDIYTFGKAQLYFDYNRLNTTLDNIYDNIHSGAYNAGFSQFINEMSNYYDKGIPTTMENYTLDENGFLKQLPAKYKAPIGIAFIISIVVTFIIIMILIKKNKMVAKATRAEEYLNKDSVNITNKVDQFISSHTTHYTTSSSSGSSGGGFSSSGGSSGGGHSSGGGRHG